ncbi:MAG: transposase [Sulfuritalea sp.]|nr:transposase [Sulfuritalea sp.]
MARYKHIDTSPRFIAVDLERQLLPGTFEHALNYLVDHQLDLSGFDTRYKNDLTGASAYPPAMLLKVVLFAYSRGIVSSREIERACREQITFIVPLGSETFEFLRFGLGACEDRGGHGVLSCAVADIPNECRRE